LISFFLDIDPQSGFQYISYVIYIAGIIWSVTLYGKQVDYNSTFGNYFAHGFKVAALVTCIMIIYIVIILNLFPDMKEKAMDAAKKSMEAKGKMTEDQINTALTMTRKFFMVFAIGTTLVGYLIFGAISSLIGAGVTKKNPHPFEG
jgi:1,4-dihydroxy-2-naphthoate octaprenyltransferase